MYWAAILDDTDWGEDQRISPERTSYWLARKTNIYDESKALIRPKTNKKIKFWMEDGIQPETGVADLKKMLKTWTFPKDSVSHFCL